MFFISHRGNLNGKIPELENSPNYILNALQLGFDVEVDVWFHNNQFYLGHDCPQYPIDITFLQNENIWCHAKNLQALESLLENECHVFFHYNDSYTLTSKQYIWSFPGHPLSLSCIIVLPELISYYTEQELTSCSGICSDFIDIYRSKSSGVPKQ